jgi:hypothetical protein
VEAAKVQASKLLIADCRLHGTVMSGQNLEISWDHTRRLVAAPGKRHRRDDVARGSHPERRGDPRAQRNDDDEDRRAH